MMGYTRKKTVPSPYRRGNCLLFFPEKRVFFPPQILFFLPKVHIIHHIKKRRKQTNKTSSSAKTIMAKTRFMAALLVMLLLLPACVQPPPSEQSVFQQKANLLWEEVQSSWDQTNKFPARKVGNAVFFSISDGDSRADVCHDTGRSLESAWKAAVKKTEKFLRENPKDVVWVKADVVCSSEIITVAQLSEKLLNTPAQQSPQGLSFDKSFDIALIESELNGSCIYDYRNGAANMPNLNMYLESAGRDLLETYPDKFTAFYCRSWFCDENNEICELIPDGDNFGRRNVENLDADYTRWVIDKAATYLSNQVDEDGSFLYQYYPRFDEVVMDYNIIRHAGTIWSMTQAYQLSHDEPLAKNIKEAIEYMIACIVYDEEGRAFLYDDVDDEVALGGCALTAMALIEYTEVFKDDEYRDLCVALGEAILSLQNQSTGEYYHILDKDLNRQEPYRTVYYDGEATLALCRLYKLTGEDRWLEAAGHAVDHFIEKDYTQYHDHWVAYSLNEITKYVKNKPEYWAFAMKNITGNMEFIMMNRASPTTFEMLLAAFETYDRMPDKSILSQEDLELFMNAIEVRAQWMLNSFFYPEYAMFMENPQQILWTFMMRNDGFRVRIDDVQHNIGGCYLYQKNLDKIKALSESLPDSHDGDFKIYSTTSTGNQL